MSGVAIVGHGHYAPERVVPNRQIEARLGLEAGWIKRRTGIDARRYAAEGEALSDIAVKAGEMALARSGMSRDDVGLLLLATSTPDHLLPPSAPLVAHRLRLSNAGAIDMAGACAGFLYALTLADSFVRTQGIPVLVIAANILSRRINESDRGSSVLFADAAGAVLLAPTERRDAGIIGAHLASKGQHYDLIKIPGGGSRMPFSQITDPKDVLMVMEDGKAVYQGAVAIMTDCAERSLAKAGLAPSAVTDLIPHQANARMMTTIAHQLDIPPDRLRSTIENFGNSSAATIPFTLSATAEARPYKQGDVVLMTAAGAGLTGGAAVFHW
ncbi:MULTISPECIES: beta-ketoacyl-ACP synthase III [unclassified Hyphomicrobium]|uniref:beta-ketoacyl-ACP synthase III n=1 Tax=unclassified Hyphomicrobium TaxID=2619925 RepID=UPI000213E008|nr:MULTISPECIES: beta-ketoacyl-ACP synthase III [unclassified Hyphomicrobium]CCB67649.1 3-oxoacyl-[acyl-carrier-protein] synthase 3 2 [Hyphomicrobium sp. MC1]